MREVGGTSTTTSPRTRLRQARTTPFRRPPSSTSSAPLMCCMRQRWQIPRPPQTLLSGMPAAKAASSSVCPASMVTLRASD